MLKTIRIIMACGGGRLARQILMCYAIMMAFGFIMGGPTIANRLTTGLILCGTTTVLMALLIGWKVGWFRYRNREALKEIAAARARTAAMTPDELRAHAESLVATTPYFLAFPATRLPDESLPPAVREFFEKWDRVDFCLPGNPSAYLSICRDLVGKVPENLDAVKVGETYTVGSCIAVSLQTGRVTCHNPPIHKREVERLGQIEDLHNRSLWHLLANLGDAQRIAEGRGFAPFPRTPVLDKRPKWRTAGAKD